MERYGKFMLLRLGVSDAKFNEGEAALLVHLGMTGSLMPRPVSATQAKHTHVVMLLDDGRELRYVDPRRFGRMAYLAGEVLSGGVAAVRRGSAGRRTGGICAKDPRAQGAGSKRCCWTRA